MRTLCSRAPTCSRFRASGLAHTVATEHVCDERLCDAVQMFARELAEGWTSWGNEVLKFQQLGTYLTPVRHENC